MKKLIENKNKIILASIIVILASIIIILIILNGNTKNEISGLERMKLEEIAKETMPYLEDYDGKNMSIGNYMYYALKSNYYRNSEDTMSVKEIIKITKETFNKKITEKEMIKETGTEYLIKRNIKFNGDVNTFTILNMEDKTYKEIADTKIIKYEIKEINKDKDEYKVTYAKYEVKNPYEILNYYNDKKANSKDIEKISGYLKGTENELTIKEYVNKDNIKKIGKILNDVNVIYKIKDNKIQIELN